MFHVCFISFYYTRNTYNFTGQTKAGKLSTMCKRQFQIHFIGKHFFYLIKSIPLGRIENKDVGQIMSAPVYLPDVYMRYSASKIWETRYDFSA